MTDGNDEVVADKVEVKIDETNLKFDARKFRITKEFPTVS